MRQVLSWPAGKVLLPSLPQAGQSGGKNFGNIALNQQALSAFLWSVADLLRGDYKQSDYGKVILPFTVLRRIDCVLAPTKDAVLAELALRESQKMPPGPFLRKKSGTTFYNADPLDLKKLMGDQDNIARNLRRYILGFSPEVRHLRAFRVRQPDRPAGQGRAVLSGG